MPNFIREYFRYVPSEKKIAYPLLSPDGKYISYMVPLGEELVGLDLSVYWDYQEIEYIPLDEPNKAIRITQHGGSWREAAWSPDSSRLAYQDYDDQGILQLYVYSIPDHTKMQLTRFTEPGLKPGPAWWSPQGNKIAFSLYAAYGSANDPFVLEGLWVVNVQDRQLRKMTWPKPAGWFWEFYWSIDEAQVLVDASASDRYEWFNVASGEMIRHMDNALDGQSLAWPFPITTDLNVIGFTANENQMYRMDVTNNWVEELPIPGELRTFEKYDISPFQGTSNCAP